MIFNKYLSIFLSACLFMLLMLLTSSVVVVFFNGGSVPYIGIAFVVIYYFIARAFYTYLRNDDEYKNNRKITSDKKDESYITKGRSDTKKVFLVVWVLIILLLSAVSLWLYSFNNGLL
ncbi:hypothetical protein [Methanobrevibacter sp.]|uniref:hypothetical protein n=1 Tax=Methanobrevibacter sp. TaxID=66852 RepID=UPI0026DF1437|nr:hypothetical protein [Methanobrevibacter sp.]MDO5859835.1 hypothetical protein [Methanobrevibacter sp.]